MKGFGRWAIIAVAALVAAALLLPGKTDYRGLPASTLSAGPAGAKALYRFLGAMGLEAVRWQGHDYQGLPDGTLWILTREPIPSLRLEALDRFLNRGNTVIGPLPAVGPLLEREGVTGIEESFAAPFEAWRPHGGKVISDGAHYLTGGPAPNAVYAVMFRNKKDLPVVARLASPEEMVGPPVIARWLAGTGQIVVLGADDIVRNDLIGEGENGPLLLDLAQHVSALAADEPQIFDEISTGVATKTWGELWGGLPYRFGLAQAGLALLVLLAAWLPRRWPVDPTPALSRRTTAEHLDAVARFWKLGRDPGLPLSELVLAASERAQRRGGAGPKPFVDWVAKLRPELEPRAVEVLSRAEALSATIPPVRAAREAAADLMRLEREAAQW